MMSTFNPDFDFASTDMLLSKLSKVFLKIQDDHLTVYMNCFGLIVNTVTVVGYGCYLPDYIADTNDLFLLMACIYVGTVMFSKFAGPLNTIFSNQLR